VLSFLGVHDFDMCQWLTGSRATRVYCESAEGLLSSQGYNVEDQTFTTIRFASGAVACVEAGWALPNNHPRQADFVLEVIGTDGVINLELMASGISICGEAGFRFPRLGNALDRQLEHFLHCIQGRESPAITGREARHAMEISLAAQESSENNRPVRL
jgi:UDP-N-acetylglucosamine 3-dehydrogenase